MMVKFSPLGGIYLYMRNDNIALNIGQRKCMTKGKMVV